VTLSVDERVVAPVTFTVLPNVVAPETFAVPKISNLYPGAVVPIPTFPVEPLTKN
jgi:hypothetical protein